MGPGGGACDWGRGSSVEAELVVVWERLQQGAGLAVEAGLAVSMQCWAGLRWGRGFGNRRGFDKGRGLVWTCGWRGVSVGAGLCQGAGLGVEHVVVGAGLQQGVWIGYESVWAGLRCEWSLGRCGAEHAIGAYVQGAGLTV